MTKWKDDTSYSQGERARKEPPRTWEIVLGGVKLTVTRYHGLEGWWMLCSEYGVNIHRDLREEDIEVAKRVAIRRFQPLALEAKRRATAAIEEAEEAYREGFEGKETS